MAIRFIPALLAYLVSLPLFAATPYTPPEAGDMADLVINVRPGLNTEWTVDIFDDPKTCAGAKLVLAGEDKGDKTATKIAANTLVTIGYDEHGGARSGCEITSSFTPQAGRVYFLEIKGFRAHCIKTLTDVTDLNNRTVVPLIQRNLSRALPCNPL